MSQSDPPQKLAYELPDAERPASAAPAAEIIAATAPRHDPYAALRYRDFRLYVLGWMLSVIGRQVIDAAVGWDIYQRTRDPMMLGWVGLVAAAPVILLALPAGHLADRFDRRRIIMTMQCLSCLCAITLGILSFYHGPLLAIFAVLALAAIGKALGWPARSALLPSLAPPQAFANAVTWNSSAFQLAAMAGPGLGGLILFWSSPLAYFFAALCGVSFIILLTAITYRRTASPQEPATFQTLVAGIRFVLATKIILATITLDLFAVLLGGAVALMPIFAKDILHIGALGYGSLRAAPALGALSMSILVAHLPPMRRAGRTMLWAVAGFGLATIVFGLSHNVWLSLAMMFLTGACDNISVVVRHTLVQVLTPDAMRGRVSAVNNIFIGSSNELGSFESGLTARLFGAITSVVAGGIGTVVVVLSVAGIWPQVRRFGSLVDAKTPPSPTAAQTE